MNTIYTEIANLIKNGATTFFAGNGGSAAIAQHATAEFMVKYKKFRPPIPAICLNADTAILTAHANDFGYETVFGRQLDALCKKNDVVILMSTSGRSVNIWRAADAAADKKAFSIALCGAGGMAGGKYARVVKAQSVDTASIQLEHLQWLHNLCEHLDNEF